MKRLLRVMSLAIALSLVPIQPIMADTSVGVNHGTISISAKLPVDTGRILTTKFDNTNYNVTCNGQTLNVFTLKGNTLVNILDLARQEQGNEAVPTLGMIDDWSIVNNIIVGTKNIMGVKMEGGIYVPIRAIEESFPFELKDKTIDIKILPDRQKIDISKITADEKSIYTELFTNNSIKESEVKSLFPQYDYKAKPKINKKTLEDHIITYYVNSLNKKSKTNNLVYTDLGRQRTYVFGKSTDDSWVLLKNLLCSTGKPHTPTPIGEYELTKRVPCFGHNKGYCCQNAYGFIGTTYLYHSTIFETDEKTPREGVGVLGNMASAGCIRFSLEDSKWFYDTLEPSTKVIIK